MIKKISSILLVCISLLSCQNDKKQDPFEISYNRIGHLTNTIKVSQLDSIYANDSIVKMSKNDNIMDVANTIEIYEKGGAKLLLLEPREENNPESSIESIQVIDPRYKTISGLSANGVFKDIKDNYSITKITNTLSAAVIFVDSIQASITIDKKELSSELKFNTDKKIEASQIPDSATIKHFIINWENN
ncbi:hypothetical protein J8L88_19455 [Aquimarina sp. MMG015]|uniref:hypothetical protein n=1 Tax=Aquimarina TaxID=290174 RepID=UPI00048074CE|nr:MULTISPECIES: hypothetical protein [Aquimarina]MBQ4805050.1 hypothetical protein [Aquimarina sp. MMG015]